MMDEDARFVYLPFYFSYHWPSLLFYFRLLLFFFLFSFLFFFFFE